ncbi:unnamed protein product [Eretmochelys imbricata]
MRRVGGHWVGGGLGGEEIQGGHVKCAGRVCPSVHPSPPSSGVWLDRELPPPVAIETPPRCSSASSCLLWPPALPSSLGGTGVGCSLDPNRLLESLGRCWLPRGYALLAV